VQWCRSLSTGVFGIGDLALTLASVPGPRPLPGRVLNAYVARMQAAAEHDPVIADRLLRIISLQDPPTRMFRPPTAIPVLLRSLRRRRRSTPARSTRPSPVHAPEPAGHPPGGATRSGGLSNVPLPVPHLVGIAVAVWLDRRFPSPPPGPRYGRVLVGWPLAISGVCLIGRAWTAAMPVRLADPALLVTSGPYAAGRNPMYLGWALLQLGAGLVRGSRGMIAAVPAAAAFVHPDVRREERTLEETFGDEFRRYRATVPRYLPRGHTGYHRSHQRRLAFTTHGSRAAVPS
jgi:protein-S-isoprenylcysteine O-methyltransferase Ste14